MVYHLSLKNQLESTKLTTFWTYVKLSRCHVSYANDGIFELSEKRED